MATDVQPVNWWVVMASSAVIGAVVNNGISLWTRHRDRQRDAAVVASRQAYARLDVARALEMFGQRASAYLRVIDADLRSRPVSRDGASEWVSQDRLAFEFDPEPVWTDLPLQLVAAARELPVAFKISSEWVRDALANKADPADIYSLKAQQAMHYGLLAGELANEIRRDIGVEPSAAVTYYLDQFFVDIRRIHENFVRSAGRLNVLPALLERFTSGPIRRTW